MTPPTAAELVASDRFPEPASMRAWKPPVAGIREVLHARFADHVYPLHTHDVWTLFLVDEGTIRYDLDRSQRGAVPSMVSVLPPHVVHDGRPGSADGYRKRVLYLETSVLGEHLVGPAVDRPVLREPSLRRRLDVLHAVLEDGDDPLEAEVRLEAVAELIRADLGERPSPDADDRPAADLAEALRAYLDARRFDAPTMAEAAAAIDASPTRLARAFSSTFAIAPHAYLEGRRLEAARDRILGGQSLADVAAELGYVDQAHLTRRFKRFLGTTPGRFAGRRSG
jgi:AraC-like DNA-binding protein